MRSILRLSGTFFSHFWRLAFPIPLPHISTTQPQLELTQIRKKRFSVPTISTLLPENLAYSDFLVLAGREWPSFHTQFSLRSQAPVKHGSGKYRPSILLNYRGKVVHRPDGTKLNVESKDDGTTTAAGVVPNEEKRRVVHTPFPGHAQGFLYLHQHPPESGLPRSASSIRFRCAPSLVEVSTSYITSLISVKKSKARSKPIIFLPPSLKNPEIYEAFKAGYDLMLPDGTPWSIPVVTVAGRPSLNHVRTQLLEDKLFNGNELQEYGGIYYKRSTRIVTNGARKIILHTLDDAFAVRFDRTSFTVWTMAVKSDVGLEEQMKGARQPTPEWRRTRVEPGSSRFWDLFTDQRCKYGNKPPYTGIAHVRFELAPISAPSHPVLCLRIVKIIERVECVIPDYDGHIHLPQEGELVTRGLFGKSKPWICQLTPSVKSHSSMLLLVPDYIANADSC